MFIHHRQDAASGFLICLLYNSMNQKQRYHLRKSQGLCVACGQVPANCGLRCNACKDYQDEWRQHKTSALLASRLCWCGRPARHGKKTCQECNERNKRTFRRRKSKGLCSYCRNPVAPDKQTICQSCSDKYVLKRKKLREEVFNAYGGPVCNCCGETIDKFLTLDHTNNDGAQHRASVGRNSVFKWVKDHNYPPGFQVLCWNCNLGKKLNGGVCPHQQKGEHEESLVRASRST